MPDCTIGAMSVENVSGERDDLVAGLAAEEVDGQPQRRRAGVDHHAVALGEQLGAPSFELGHVGPDGESPGRLQHLDDRVDLALVVDRAGFGDGRIAPSVIRGAYRVSR